MSATVAGSDAVNRIALAIVLGYVAVFGLPIQRQPTVVVPDVPTPSSAARAAVEPVVAALASLTPQDRAVFSDLWLHVGRAVADDGNGDAVFTDTRTLRETVRVAAIVGWNRMHGKSPGNADLDAAVDAAFTKAIGTDSTVVDDKLRAAFVETCNALAWAGQR